MDREQRSEAMIERIRAIRLERFGNNVAALAAALAIPERTWLNYEDGVVMPAEIMLKFLLVCEATPEWVLNGTKPHCKRCPQPN